MKYLGHQLEQAEKLGNNICSHCHELSDMKEGTFCECKKGMILTPTNLRLVIRSQIPKIDFKALINKLPKTIKPKSVRDPTSGIRKHTKKYEVYSLWKSGVDVKTIIKNTGCNPSSVRSWVGRFRVRYGDRNS